MLLRRLGRTRLLYFYKISEVQNTNKMSNSLPSHGGGKYGGIAQLGERLNGIQEVSGSIPLISTKTPTFKEKVGVFYCEKL